ncbi:MAG TPA: hypothetical protein VHW71_08915 [Steroidobacteraceae bacterium]|jgi:hypothetical protein|nr:hypothetical protein [Steroidobacteraceae bacterium]
MSAKTLDLDRIASSASFALFGRRWTGGSKIDCSNCAGIATRTADSTLMKFSTE